MTQHTSDDKPSPGDSEARRLLKRAPNSYLINQIYNLWFFFSSFLFTVLITHAVTTGDYGVYAIIQTFINTIIYLVALGIEDATVTFVPRLLSEFGMGVASQLARYLLALRLIILFVTIALIIFGLPLLATGLALIPITGSAAIAHNLQNPLLSRSSIPIALYVFGSGIGNLFSAFSAAQMRMHIVLIIGSIAQGALLLAGFVLLTIGWGIEGILWLQALVALLNALAFVCWLAPFLLKGAPHHRLPLKNIWQVSISAWLTNLATGALFKQVSIILLGVFLISVENIGYFNLSFQLADAANLLLVSGLTGVGGSALAAAFTGQNHQRLGQTWQALIKVETLLAAPVLVFCLFNAANIPTILYGSKFDPVGPLLTIFLFFNLLVRILGTTIHQSGLYVLGKPRQVVTSHWLSILIVIGVGIICIPIFGAAGALIADGLAKTTTGILLLIFIAPHIPTTQRREVLVFTGRFMLALTLAALPCLLWHPKDRILLGISGCLFIILCLGLLWWIKPLTQPDIELLRGMNPRMASYLKYFSRSRP
ncbi:lipopolysaccharide biosynthesis protein [Dictyobacter formicarum]|nr:oligosaccharide flippase family protein [Dictyobacter formicarum]